MKRILMSLFIVLVLCFLPSCSIQGTYISLSPPYQDGSMKMVLDKGGKGYVTSDTSIYCFSYDIIIDKGHRTQAIELELDFGKKDSPITFVDFESLRITKGIFLAFGLELRIASKAFEEVLKTSIQIFE